MSSGGGSVAVQFANGAKIGGNLLPSENSTYSLGSADKRWKDLFISGDTIDIGGTQLKIVDSALRVEDESNNDASIAVENLSASNVILSGGRDLADIFSTGGTSIVTVTSTPHTPSAVNSVLLVDDDTIGGAAVVILPAATGNSGIEFTVKKLGNTGTVSVSGRVGDTVDGQTVQSIGTKFDSIKVITNGSDWYVISDNVTSALQLE